jgi:hypothetical protein
MNPAPSCTKDVCSPSRAFKVSRDVGIGIGIGSILATWSLEASRVLLVAHFIATVINC